MQDLSAGHIDLVAGSATQIHLPARYFCQIAGPKNAITQIFIRFGPIGQADGLSLNVQAAISVHTYLDVLHGSTNTRGIDSRLVTTIIRNSAAFGAAVEVMDLQTEVFENVLLQP